MMAAFKAEWIKTIRSRIVWITFIAFALAPLMGAVFILITRSPDAMARSGSFSAKAQAMNFTASWPSYIGMLVQAIGVGGVILFGFVASWVFGREYTSGTAKDLMALPTSRTKILNAKFMVYIIWSIALAISNLLIGLLIGIILQLPSAPIEVWLPILKLYLITTFLALILGPSIAFLALWGKGYLAPLGFIALAVVLAQVISAVGYGHYFPWAVPGLYSGTAGEYKEKLNIFSYLGLALTAFIGYLACVLYWKHADQTK
jgi:ABC-type transport system involved in multi-copper enzyme maturation permease subunit